MFIHLFVSFVYSKFVLLRNHAYDIDIEYYKNTSGTGRMEKQRGDGGSIYETNREHTNHKSKKTRK